MATKNIKFNIFRLILQWIILGLLGYMVIRLWTDKAYFADFETYCPFGGLQSLGSYLVNNTLACSMTTIQIAMGIVLMAGVLLFSKLFCGYLCPIGTLTEWIGKLGDMMRIRVTIKGGLDRIIRMLKYALLLLTFYFTLESSELFCKKYDPFYAVFTWFSYDVNLWYAIIALFVTITGALVVRQFWCKYLCPLAALSNIFTFILLFIGVFGIYIILRISGLHIGWIWPLIVICSLAWVIEAFRLKGLFMPLLRITRNDTLCTHCKICDKVCPQGIKISQCDIKIRHIDCNLCTDCIAVCPNKGSLTINKLRMRWLPSLLTVILVISGLLMGAYWELPTVDQRWGTDEEMRNAKVFEMSGLKSIKCYGSSMGFISQMHEVNGVLGAATYAGSHSVKVFYNPAIISENQVKAAIFSPLKYIFAKLHPLPFQIQVLELYINRFFDRFDSYYLTKLFEQQESIYGFETQYGEPVIVRIYFVQQSLTPEKIRQIIESKSVTYTFRGEQYTEPLNFTVPKINPVILTIDSLSFRQRLFEPYKDIFMSSEQAEASHIKIYQIHMPQAADPNLSMWLPYLGNHLSADSGIVSFETIYDTSAIAIIRYDTVITSQDKIFELLTADSLTIIYTDGTIGKVVNPFEFR